MRYSILLLPLLLTGCIDFSKLFSRDGEGVSFTAPIMVWKDEYVLSADISAAGDWCYLAPNRRECPIQMAAIFPAGDFHIVDGELDPVKLIKAKVPGELSINSIPEEVPYDETKDLCKTRGANGFSCSPNFVLKTSLLPSDPLYGNLWGLKRANFPKFWNVASGNGIVVAVIDSGASHHPDLNSQVLWDKGYNAINEGSDVTDENGHGTHVSGTIGAAWNDVGIAGACHLCKILPIKFIGANGSGSLFAAIRAIDYASQHGARIINASWGGGGYSQPLYDSIKRATGAGVLFVAAAGNEGVNNDNYPHFPGDYDLPGIVSVGAIAPDGSLASFSNFGKKSVDIAAPGTSILSTYLNEGFQSLSGTSMAAPHVSGLAALILSRDPTYTVAGLKKRILKRASQTKALRGKIAKRRELQATP